MFDTEREKKNNFIEMTIETLLSLEWRVKRSIRESKTLVSVEEGKTDL